MWRKFLFLNFYALLLHVLVKLTNFVNTHKAVKTNRTYNNICTIDVYFLRTHLRYTTTSRNHGNIARSVSEFKDFGLGGGGSQIRSLGPPQNTSDLFSHFTPRFRKQSGIWLETHPHRPRISSASMDEFPCNSMEIRLLVWTGLRTGVVVIVDRIPLPCLAQSTAPQHGWPCDLEADKHPCSFGNLPPFVRCMKRAKCSWTGSCRKPGQQNIVSVHAWTRSHVCLQGGLHHAVGGGFQSVQFWRQWQDVEVCAQGAVDSTQGTSLWQLGCVTSVVLWKWEQNGWNCRFLIQRSVRKFRAFFFLTTDDAATPTLHARLVQARTAETNRFSTVVLACC